MKKKNADLYLVMSALKEKKILSEQSLLVLESCAGQVADLIKRQIAKNTGKHLSARYGHELKSFGVTLTFYSP